MLIYGDWMKIKIGILLMGLMPFLNGMNVNSFFYTVEFDKDGETYQSIHEVAQPEWKIQFNNDGIARIIERGSNRIYRINCRRKKETTLIPPTFNDKYPLIVYINTEGKLLLGELDKTQLSVYEASNDPQEAEIKTNGERVVIYSAGKSKYFNPRMLLKYLKDRKKRVR